MNLRTEIVLMLTVFVLSCGVSLVLWLMGLQVGLWILGVS